MNEITIGSVIKIAEDYLYGIGDLTLRVLSFAAAEDGPAWIKVRGIEIRWDGGERQERVVTVRRTGMRLVTP